MPSASATAAPRSHPIIVCGPPMVPTNNGIVMNGPIPTISDMLRLTAWSSVKRRSSISWLILVAQDGGAKEIGEPARRVLHARLLSDACQYQRGVLAAEPEAVGDRRPHGN